MYKTFFNKRQRGSSKLAFRKYLHFFKFAHGAKECYYLPSARYTHVYLITPSLTLAFFRT